MPDVVYTIGHSTHSMEKLTNLLTAHRVAAVADVRSHPYSRFNSQFNREKLQAALKTAGISYVFLGRELGGRPEDRTCYVDGTVQYDRLARTGLFQEGLSRIVEGVKKYRIALLCAEKDPLTCHRSILVCRHLVTRGITAQHILEDSRLESHDEALGRLLKELGLSKGDLFLSHDDFIVEAYNRRGQEIAYTEKDRLPEEPLREVQRGSKMRVFTIGFTKTSAKSFFTRLQKSGVKKVIDVRLNNVSQLAGFAKRDDLRYFLKTLCGIEYAHLPELAPTQEMLDAYKKRKGQWADYEEKFLELMRGRGIEGTIPRESVDGACFLCSEDKPDHCHRRLVAEYLKSKWGDLDIVHL